MEIHKKKSERTIIKCIDCGFKYYDGDFHLCKPASVEEEIKEPEDQKETKKTHKAPFKIWQK